MGKTKRGRLSSSSNLSPLGLSRRFKSVDGSLIEECQNGPLYIESIRDQLQNCNKEEKLNGLQSLAVLSASKEKVAAICSTDIVRIAAPLLFEQDDSLRNAAAGALRNLSVCGSEVCEYLVDQDILTPLIALLSEYFNDNRWIPSIDESMNGELDLKSDVFLQVRII